MSGDASRAWRELRRNRAAVACGLLLVAMYLAALGAEFLSPGPWDVEDPEHPFQPPSRVHVRDAAGRWVAPYVWATELSYGAAGDFRYREVPGRRFPIRWFSTGEPYRWLGLIASRRHLATVEPPARLAPLGTDAYGRDQLARLLHGARVSLSVGILGVCISLVLGSLVGGVAGYCGGPVDGGLMRLAEVVLSVPALYLVLALRAVFPVALPSVQVYMLTVLLLACVYWAGLARVIRGMVLGLRERDFVVAARALGAGPLRILVRHILPNTASYLVVAATVSVPGYILGEVALSYLGVGIQEPHASWGNMLRQAQNLSYMRSYPWVLSPGVAIFLAVMSFNFLGDGLRDALDPRRASGGRA
ncbi:MAG: ABC transporter permease [Candidatus Eisenbacteria bacterium]|nr:ABC transporter permease [Candidatus Eisenbacteria bacterium]